eukprot:1157245-Pelagomonas_calceolata.AAC.2
MEQEQLAWHALIYACMREQGMVCCRKVRLLPQADLEKSDKEYELYTDPVQACPLPQALHINATSVSGRTGFANFSASLAMLPSLVLFLNMQDASTACKD